MWSEELCGAEFWLKGWFHRLRPSENHQGGEPSTLQSGAEVMVDACNETELQIPKGKKKKREDEGESRDDDETARPMVMETAKGSHSSTGSSTMPSLDLVPSDALEKIEQAKAKASLMLAALQGLKKVIQSKKGIQQLRKRQRSSTLPLDFVSTKLTPIIESADSVLSQISNPELEKEMYEDLGIDDKMVGHSLSVSGRETDLVETCSIDHNKANVELGEQVQRSPGKEMTINSS